ncbi:hypothetical protein ED733_001916 [Metarhizium rileyi]|uniref:Uncharacterized protein n=1 Tax=Metarhizium rileyi (strain RCEF 4871) TaxID=1649241 RepID=A0A5C6GIQ7_METRR|nr:hypothetical protein ED733_001916 [Metarhizium rileyi]
MMIFENCGTPRTIQLYKTTDIFASDLLTLYDNQLLHDPHAVRNADDARERMTMRTLLRTIMHCFIFIDGIIDEEYDAFDAVRQAFLAVMDEENRSIWTEHDINITSTMTDAWESTGVWFWACVRSINAWLFVFGDHILPKFSADRALVVNLKQVSTFWHENVDQDVKAKVDDEHRYQAELRSFIDKEP